LASDWAVAEADAEEEVVMEADDDEVGEWESAFRSSSGVEEDEEEEEEETREDETAEGEAEYSEWQQP